MEKQILGTFEAPMKTFGDGAHAYECIGHPKLKSLDPFATFDDYEVTLPHGFPDHAHRGFETTSAVPVDISHRLWTAFSFFHVTYILEGKTRNEDFFGNKATLHTGDVAYTTIGRGIVHTEMPYPHVRGLQVWINLKSPEKESEPSYLKLKRDEISRAEFDGVSVVILGGLAIDNQAPMRTRNSQAHFYVFTVQPNTTFSHPEPNKWNCLAYVVEGALEFNGQFTDVHHCVVFGDGDIIRFENKGSTPAIFALIAGKPLEDPIVLEENFVVRSEEEVKQTLDDLHACKNGFENAKDWSSAIQHEK